LAEEKGQNVDIKGVIRGWKSKDRHYNGHIAMGLNGLLTKENTEKLKEGY
jgi:hypothetical protein